MTKKKSSEIQTILAFFAISINRTPFLIEFFFSMTEFENKIAPGLFEVHPFSVLYVKEC